MCGVVYHFSRRGGAVAGNHIFLLGIGVMSSRRGMTRIFGHGLPRCRQPGCKWDTHMYAGRRGRRPLPRTAPHPHTHTARRTRTPRPHTHAMRAPGRARRPRRAAPTERPRDDIGDAHGRAGRRGRRPLPRTAPHPHTHTARRTRTPHPHTHGARLPCQRIETLMGFRNAAAKSRTRACHAFASFTAPAPLQVAPAQ